MENTELLRELKKFIAHDLVAPLANNKTYFSLLKSRNHTSKEREELLARIEENNLLALEMLLKKRE